MNTFSKWGFLTCGLVLLSCAVACAPESAGEGDDELQVDEDESAVRGNAAPSNTDRVLGCDLAPVQKRATFRGKAIEYFASDEIDYASDAWYGDDAPWTSPDALDSTLLGTAGFPSPNRAFAPASANVRVSVVDVRNVGGKLAYHYFSNETGTSRIENWSSTKALVMLQAGQTLRTESNGAVGLVSTVFGGSPSGAWVGTHVTEVARTSDNGTAVWFKSITGPSGSTNFVRNWLDTKAEFGGGHGSEPRRLGNRFKANNQGSELRSTKAGTFAGTSNNTLMPITMAEFWKRLAVNEADPATWLKKANYAGPVMDATTRKQKLFGKDASFALNSDDLKVLQYGFINSKDTGGLLLGATQHPEFVDAFGGKAKLDTLTGGKWRLFGKTGSGSASRSGGARSEAVFGGFVCIPANPARATLKEGRLVAFFVNAQAPGSASAVRVRALRGIADAMIPELSGARNLWGL
jgi:hypothetical protein